MYLGRTRVDYPKTEIKELEEAKLKCAELIDLVESRKDADPKSAQKAIDAFEEALLWMMKVYSTPEEYQRPFNF